MFSQKKSFYQRKSFYGITLALLLAFGFWINHDPNTQGSDDLNEPVVNTGEQVPSAGKNDGNIKNTDYASQQWENGGFGGSSGQNYDPDGAQGGDGSELPSEGVGKMGDGNSDDIEKLQGPCYLIKENSGYIKIYSVDEAGAQHLVRTTDISFSLLSESDQKLFQKGIIKKTKDELSNLLQDFES